MENTLLCLAIAPMVGFVILIFAELWVSYKTDKILVLCFLFAGWMAWGITYMVRQ